MFWAYKEASDLDENACECGAHWSTQGAISCGTEIHPMGLIFPFP